MTFPDAIALTPPHVRGVLDALVALGAAPCRIDEPDEDDAAPFWLLSWSTDAYYADIMVYQDSVEWIASVLETTEAAGSDGDREPLGLPPALIPWLRRFGVVR